jgi:radical SAM protein with 4Fe4S-binding SPASM domain
LLNGARDILRIESFGALYYSRARASFAPIPPAETDLLLSATESSLFDAWARRPADFSISKDALIALAARWQDEGWLDEDLRVNAEVIWKSSPPGVLNGPLVTNLQLTKACNLRCTHCYVDIQPRPAPGELTTAEIIELFAELELIGSPLVILAGGEPMLRPDLDEIIAGLSRHRLDAWLCTNATTLRDEVAEKLAASPLRGVQVSLDGPDAETHDVIRGKGRFEQALRGARSLVRARARDVHLRVTVTAINVDRLLDFAPIAESLGVSRIVFKPFRRTGEASERVELDIDHVRYRTAIDRARDLWPSSAPPSEWSDGIPKRAPEWTRITPSFGCVGGTTSATVTATGSVVACGSVLTPEDWRLPRHSFRECWYGAPNLASWRHFEANDSCTSCGSFKACGGGCRARAIGMGRTITSSDPWSYCSTEGKVRPGHSRLVVLS